MAHKKPQNNVVEYHVSASEKGAMVTMPKASTTSKSNPDANPVAAAATAKSDGRGSDRYAKWDVPKLIFDKIERVPMAYSAIENKANALMGQGIGYMRRSDVMAGNYRRHYDPEIEKFIQSSSIYEYLEGKAYDMASLYNGFTQHIMGMGYNKIVQLKQLECEYSRVSKYSEAKKTLDRQYLYYSGEFSRTISDATLDDKSKCTTFDLYNPFDMSWLPNIAAKRKGTFATHSRVKTPRSFYYATPPHLGLYREKGWVDVAGNTSDVVYAMQTNQISLKYIIYISVEYFESRFTKAKWMAMKPEEQLTKYEEVRKEIEDKLVGTNNVYSSLTLMCDKDFQGNLRKTIQIEPIDDKAKSGTWVPDADHANKQIAMGHNVPASMYDLTNSNVKMNTSSGSANREGFNTMITLNTPMQRLFLSDLQIQADFNALSFPNWDVIYFVDDITHTTTNDKETGIVKPQEK
jgi:hypothetical protein